MMEIVPRLVPVFWGALAAMGVAGIVLIVSFTLMLGAQRPVVLRVIWVAASVLIAAGTALIVILAHR
jgi:hypothetical protein